jgi:hypothetical protein
MNNKVNRIVNDIRYLDITGEEIEFIINEVGMTSQILRQLVLKASDRELEDLLEEKNELKNLDFHK